jgi:hypothetical protein
MVRTLVQELDNLHAWYVEEINLAVAEDDIDRAFQLADAYDDNAIRLMAERENLTHLLPITRGGTKSATKPDSSLRRLIGRLNLPCAA